MEDAERIKTIEATTNHDVKAIGTAGVAALAPVIMRWLNPNDPAFGRGK